MCEIALPKKKKPLNNQDTLFKMVKNKSCPGVGTSGRRRENGESEERQI
jgi:hypothetical protein